MRTTRMEDYIPKLKEKFPDLDEKIIRSIIKEGCGNILDQIVNGQDVLLEHSRYDIKFLIYKPDFSKKNRFRKIKVKKEYAQENCQ